MKPNKYYQDLKPHERKQVRRALEAAHKRPWITIYKWFRNGSHPADDERLSITERVTRYAVTRFDLRPDVFSLNNLTSLVAKMGAREVELRGKCDE